jgi:cytochrome oxidase Cu insertion factor (SCO1/SenC/PrrC family)
LRHVGSAAEAARRIDSMRLLPDAGRRLAAMLPEESSLYAGRGSSEAERLRGYVLASFEKTGLPSEAVPFVLEELETGRNPYTVAAAARALRGSSAVPVEAPELLVAAIARLRASDEVVSFERFAPGPTVGTAATSLFELASTLVMLGPRARGALPSLKQLVESESRSFSPTVSAELAEALKALAVADAPAPDFCCDEPARTACHDVEDAFALAAPSDLAELTLESQDGARLTFSEAFSGRPTALAFFYTRCPTPEKCSLTVTRLARLARRLEAAHVDANIAGISYDPAFDGPARLKRYGVDRGMVFSPRCSLLRTVGPFAPLVTAFRLGVGFGPVTVNQHRLELVVLDASLALVQRFQRRQWHEKTVLDALCSAMSQ